MQIRHVTKRVGDTVTPYLGGTSLQRLARAQESRPQYESRSASPPCWPSTIATTTRAACGVGGDESFYGDDDAHANQYWANHVAKVVVAELGLTEERAMHAVCPQEPVASSRYVTAWEPQ